MEDRKAIEAANFRRQLEQSVDERCAELRHEITILLEGIREELDAHAKRGPRNPWDWEPVKALASMRSKTKDVLRALLVANRGHSVSSAERAIKRRLDEGR